MEIEALYNFFEEQDKLLAGIAAILAIFTAIYKLLKDKIIRFLNLIALKVRNIRKLKSINLPSRKAYMDALIANLKITDESYRAVIVGPLFLSPDWVFERRNRDSTTDSYDDKLYRFMLSKCIERNHNIRLILRNSKRYIEKINRLVLPKERSRFKEDVLKNMERLWGDGDRGPDLVCSDVGHFRIDVIFDKVMISAARLSQERPVNGGYLSYDIRDIEQQRVLFDQVFDELTSSNRSDILKLKEYIENLWNE